MFGGEGFASCCTSQSSHVFLGVISVAVKECRCIRSCPITATRTPNNGTNATLSSAIQVHWSPTRPFAVYMQLTRRRGRRFLLATMHTSRKGHDQVTGGCRLRLPSRVTAAIHDTQIQRKVEDHEKVLAKGRDVRSPQNVTLSVHHALASG